MMISPISSHLSFSSSTLPAPKNTKLSHPSLSLHETIKSQHRVQHTPSTAYTEYSIHQVQHTPCTASTEYCIHRILHHPKINCLPLSASFPSLGRPCCTQFSTFPQLRVNQWIESQLPISKMKFGPEATRILPRHSGRPQQCFQVLPDAPRPPWS